MWLPVRKLSEQQIKNLQRIQNLRPNLRVSQTSGASISFIIFSISKATRALPKPPLSTKPADKNLQHLQHFKHLQHLQTSPYHTYPPIGLFAETWDHPDCLFVQRASPNISKHLPTNSKKIRPKIASARRAKTPFSS